LGNSEPHGNAVYVLRRNTETNQVEIWNPITGEPFVFCNEKLIN